MLPCLPALLLLPVQNGRLPDAEGAAGVGPLPTRVPQTLAGLASHQHGRYVVDLVSGLGAGALLGLRDPTTFAPAPAGVEDQDQTQDGQQEGNHPALVRRRLAEGARGRRGEEEEESQSKAAVQ